MIGSFSPIVENTPKANDRSFCFPALQFVDYIKPKPDPYWEIGPSGTIEVAIF